MEHCTLQNDYLNLSELVRSIQRSSGDPDCFRRGPPYCDKLDCIWRSLCQESLVNSKLKEIVGNNNN
jgi:hypothetical protein